MRKTCFFIILILSQITFSFSQKISGKLLYIDNEDPAGGNVYINGIADIVATENIQEDGTFTISNLDNISTIEINNISGSIILTGFDDTKDYDLGKLYFIDNPNNEIVHVVYKTKLGYYFRWLTEGCRTRKWKMKKIKENHNVLKYKYMADGKPSKFIKKYNGNKQILNLKSLG